MSAADKLKARGITPTIDACKAYDLGREEASRLTRRQLEVCQAKVEKLERALTEIRLMAGRAR
jgi:hypothetical protein